MLPDSLRSYGIYNTMSGHGVPYFDRCVPLTLSLSKGVPNCFRTSYRDHLNVGYWNLFVICILELVIFV